MVMTSSQMLPLGTRAPAFTLPGVDGGQFSSDDLRTPFVVVFMCNHCPFVQHLREALADLGREALRRGFALVGICSNDVDAYPADNMEAMQREAERYGYVFPYLLDASQEVALAYQAACTPDLYLFDAEHRLVYRGQFDDSRPGNGRPVTGSSLRAALDAVLEGRPVPSEQTPSVGCNIKWKPGRAPAWFG